MLLTSAGTSADAPAWSGTLGRDALTGPETSGGDHGGPVLGIVRTAAACVAGETAFSMGCPPNKWSIGRVLVCQRLR